MPVLPAALPVRVSMPLPALRPAPPAPRQLPVPEDPPREVLTPPPLQLV
jgi:hypothetical protein